MTPFLPGTRLVIDSVPCVVQHVHAPSAYYAQIYTVQKAGVKRVKLGLTKDGVWRYGLAGRPVIVTWDACDGCKRALLEDERDRCDECLRLEGPHKARGMQRNDGDVRELVRLPDGRHVFR